MRLNDRPLAATMRTPGRDDELARGFLHGTASIDAALRLAPP